MAKKFIVTAQDTGSELNYYTDRRLASIQTVLSQIEKIDQNIATNADPDYCLINVYGIGGEGKSFFVAKVLEELKKSNHQYILYNADRKYGMKSHNMVQTLIYLRNELVRNYGFTFDEFSVRAAAFMGTENCQFDSYHAGSVKEVGWNVFEHLLLESGKTIADVFTFGFASGITEAVLEGKGTLEQNKIDRIRGILMREKEENPRLALQKLKEAFINEYNQNVVKSSKSFEIIFDTFEDYIQLSGDWLFTDNPGSEYSIGLCHALDKTVWIIAGRDSLHLSQKDSWDEAHYQEVCLTNFTLEESTEYLKKKLNETLGAELFFHQTGGEPLIAYYLTDYIQRHHLTGEALTEFLSSERQTLMKEGGLLSRYLRYLEYDANITGDHTLANWLEVLICLGSWAEGEDAFWSPELLSLVKKDGGFLSLVQIQQKSLVNVVETETGNRYHIEKNIAELLLDSVYPSGHLLAGQPVIQPAIQKATYTYLCGKWKQFGALSQDDLYQMIRLLDGIGVKDNNQKIQRIFLQDAAEYFQVGQKKESVEARIYLLNRLVSNQSSAEVLLHPQVLPAMLSDCTDEVGFLYIKEIEDLLKKLPSDIYESECVAQYLASCGDLQTAAQLYDCIHQKGKMTDEWLFAYMSLLIKLQRVEELQHLLSTVPVPSKDFSILNDKEKKIFVMLTLYRSAALISQGDEWGGLTTLAVLQREDIVSYMRECGIWLEYLQRFQIALSVNNRLDESEQCCHLILNYLDRETESVATRILYANTLNNLATIYNKKNDPQKVIEYTEKAALIREEIYPDTHEELLQSNNNRAFVLLNTGKPEEALRIFEKNLSLLEQTLGKDHPRVAKCIFNMGVCYKNMQQPQRAIPYMEQAISIKASLWGSPYANYELVKNQLSLMETRCMALSNSTYSGVLERFEQLLREELPQNMNQQQFLVIQQYKWQIFQNINRYRSLIHAGWVQGFQETFQNGSMEVQKLASNKLLRMMAYLFDSGFRYGSECYVSNWTDLKPVQVVIETVMNTKGRAYFSALVNQLNFEHIFENGYQGFIDFHEKSIFAGIEASYLSTHAVDSGISPEQLRNEVTKVYSETQTDLMLSYFKFKNFDVFLTKHLGDQND